MNNSSYTENIHKSGRRWFILVWFFLLLFPTATSIYFDAWPTWKEFLGAAIGVIPVYWTVGVVEAFTYMPMLGAGGSYLGFITGNMSNLKVPVALNAMDSMNVKQGTEEGDVISTIAIAVSSIVTVFIIIIFVILMVPLSPIFENPVLQPAFDNVVPALFGGLMIAYIAKCPKVSLPIIIGTAALFIAIPYLGGIYPLILPAVACIAILLSRILYKKGKI
ncbi:MAG: hypothetical protein MJ059_00565 [Lachnospiraceae bacterium]|nr:hypothetical protein [Lachnospiraceae bacterium]